jgi:N-acetylmuramoyl-L-alanine amidase
LVIVDPGHGGPDLGALGPSGAREKDAVLAVGKRLAEVLQGRGYEARMTRSTDTLIALEDRPHLANEWRGDRPALFLSIHANWVRDRSVRGFETFFLSDARTEDERRVAEMENAAVQYQSGPSIADTDELGTIRNSVRNDYYIRASYELAGLVQSELRGVNRGADRGVKQAGFIVLIGAFMPAVLIEVGFISNPSEERLLGTESFQTDLAEGIADAVDRFFEREGQRWTGSFP